MFSLIESFGLDGVTIIAHEKPWWEACAYTIGVVLHIYNTHPLDIAKEIFKTG